MTSDYYFKKWKKTLEKLKSLIELDTEYQVYLNLNFDWITFRHNSKLTDFKCDGCGFDSFRKLGKKCLNTKLFCLSCYMRDTAWIKKNLVTDYKSSRPAIMRSCSPLKQYSRKLYSNIQRRPGLSTAQLTSSENWIHLWRRKSGWS